MGARAWVRQTANEPVRNLIRFLEKFSGAERTLTIRPYHGDKSGESLAFNSVRTRKTQREAERPSRELRLGTKRQERNRHFDLLAYRNPGTAAYDSVAARARYSVTSASVGGSSAIS